MYRRTRTVVLAGLAALATVGLTACGSALDGSAHAVEAGGPAASTAAPNAGTSAPAAPAPTVPAPDGARSPGAPGSPGAVTAGGGTSGGTVSGGSTAGGGSGSGGNANPPAPRAPKITSFRVVKQPTCPVQGTPDAPYSSPGSVEIAWTVSGAKGAAIAVDNPGTYGAYGSDYAASGKLTLSFPCDGQGTTTHSYTVWPAGVHDVSRTITASARSDG
jgi:hypothetical protein